jgi:triacylglycerol lipase
MSTFVRLTTAISAIAVLLASSPRSPLLADEAGADATNEAVVVQRDVPYIDDGDMRHKADIYIPPGDGPFPAVLMIHGGAWTSGNKWHMAAHARIVADAGYAVVSINYRLAPKHLFPAQIEDCKAAVRWMRTNAAKYKIDPKRIASYGYSAGGHLACLLGTTCSADGLEGVEIAADAPDSRVQCVIAGGAPCEFRNVPQRARGFNFWLGGTRGEKPEAYKLASPTSFVSKDDPPVFFFHGEDDTLVRRNSPEALRKLLTEQGIKTEFYVVSGKGHIGAFIDREPARQAVKFLDVVLRPASTP